MALFKIESPRQHQGNIRCNEQRGPIEAIERGEYPPRDAAPRGEQPTFLSAAVQYLELGRRRRYVANLIKHFGEMPLSEIDQGAIDAAAVELHPHAGPGGRNAAVYTPVSAILRHAGVKIELRRPKGAKGRVVTDWLTPDDVCGIIGAAESFDREFAALLKFLLYTGVRLGAALGLQREDVRLGELTAWVRHQKKQPAADVKLREDLRDTLATHLASHDQGRVFRFHQGGHLKHLLVRAKLGYLGLPCPTRRPTKWRAPAYRLAWAELSHLPAHLGDVDEALRRCRRAGPSRHEELARSTLCPCSRPRRMESRGPAADGGEYPGSGRQMNASALIYFTVTRSPPGAGRNFFGASLSRAGWILTAADPTRREA